MSAINTKTDFRLLAFASVLLLGACADPEPAKEPWMDPRPRSEIEFNQHIGVIAGDAVDPAAPVKNISKEAAPNTPCRTKGDLAMMQGAPFLLVCSGDKPHHLTWIIAETWWATQQEQPGGGCAKPGDFAVSPTGGLLVCGDDAAGQKP